MSIKSSQLPTQAKILLDKLKQTDKEHVKEALIADHMHTILSVAESAGYEVTDSAFIGITRDLVSEGALK